MHSLLKNYKMNKCIILVMVIASVFYPSIASAKMDAFEAEKVLFFKKWADVATDQGLGFTAGFDDYMDITALYAVGDLGVKVNGLYGLGFFYGFTLVQQYGKDPDYPGKKYKNTHIPLQSSGALNSSVRTALGFKFLSLLGNASLGISIEQRKGYPSRYYYVDELTVKPLLRYDLNIPFFDFKSVYQARRTVSQTMSDGSFSKPLYAFYEAGLNIFNKYKLAPFFAENVKRGLLGDTPEGEESDPNADKAKIVYSSIRQAGIHQDIYISSIKGFIKVAADTTYDPKLLSLSEAIKDGELRTYRLELQVSPLYFGTWYNKEFGYGGGVGLGMTENGMDDEGTCYDLHCIVKYNEIIPHPVFDRNGGWVIEMAGTFKTGAKGLGRF